MQPDHTGCTAPRHGSISAYYRAGCRCPDTKEAVRLYTKRLRTGRPEIRRIDATGVVRRIHALMALGHTAADIGAVAGMSSHHVQQTTRRRYVSPANHWRIVAAYEALSGRPGASEQTRRRARQAGWAPPLAWEFVDIDDPAAEPEEMLGRHLRSVPTDLVVDEIAVERAAGGDRTVRLTQVERDAAIRLMRQRGVSLHQISQTLGVQHKIIVRVLAQGMEARDAA